MKSGVYVFWREGSEQAEYVGSSNNAARRIGVHICNLRKRRHINPNFQNAWNKYGEAAYHAILIEVCANDLLVEREQYWIDALNPRRNIAVCSDNAMRGKHHGAEARAKISATAKGRHFSADLRAKLSEAAKGRSAETRAKLSDAKKGAKNPCFGKQFSVETRAKIGAASRLRGARQRFERAWMEPT